MSLTMRQLLVPLVQLRRLDDVVVTTMSVVRPWGELSSSALDFASADSAMGHAADLALGIAMAQPQRRVLCLNGDGSMLMSLGTLATIVAAGATNLRLLVVANGTYEITGNQPVPASDRVDYGALARAAGFPHAEAVATVGAYESALPCWLRVPGPALLAVRVQPGEQGPISRHRRERSPYLQTSLYEWSRRLRTALGADPERKGLRPPGDSS